MTNPPELGVLVTIHDQDLLLEYEAQKKFSGVEVPLTYMFVGNGPTDKIETLPNVIVAREMPDNIEDHKFLVDFTSWYALVRNNIPSPKYLALVQYDVSISQDFVDKTMQALGRAPMAVTGYAPVPMADRNFIRDNMGYAPLKSACSAVYGIEIDRLLKAHMKLSDDKMWPATNNVAMSREALEDFVRWFTPLAMHMGNEKPVGHAFERAIKLYSILSGRGNTYVNDVLSHFQLNSHETQDFKKDTSKLSRLLARNVMSQK